MLALVTAAAAAAHDDDLMPLVDALDAAGASVDVVCWDDSSIDWGRFDAAFLRSTWDYAERIGEFRKWLGGVVEQTRLVNPVDVVEWNIDKHYLSALGAAGVPVVPTLFVEPGEESSDVDCWLVDGGRRDADVGEQDREPVFVVKPAVGAGSKGARRCRPAEVAGHVATLHAAGNTAMVQPYLHMIDDHAETSLVFLGRGDRRLEFDHAFSKGAILRSTEVTEVGGLFAEEQIGSRVATVDELALAEIVLAATPLQALSPLAYARVDVVPTAAGPVLLELELIEPSLYFGASEGSAERAAAAWLAYLDGGVTSPVRPRC